MKQFIPFPQANDLMKVLKIRNILPAHKSKVKLKIKEYFGFSSRQADYYFLAGLWLRLYHENADGVIVNSLDDAILMTHLNDVLMTNKIFSNALKNKGHDKKGQLDLIVYDLMLNSNMSTSLTSTHYRRATTVLKWIEQLNDMNNGR